MASNSIRPFHRDRFAGFSRPDLEPDVHPAAFAAAQLVLINDVPFEDLVAAMAFLSDNDAEEEEEG